MQDRLFFWAKDSMLKSPKMTISDLAGSFNSESFSASMNLLEQISGGLYML